MFCLHFPLLCGLRRATGCASGQGDSFLATSVAGRAALSPRYFPLVAGGYGHGRGTPRARPFFFRLPRAVAPAPSPFTADTIVQVRVETTVGVCLGRRVS